MHGGLDARVRPPTLWWMTKPVAGRDSFVYNFQGTTYWYNGAAWIALPKDPYIANVTVLAHDLGSTGNRFGDYGLRRQLVGSGWFGLLVGASAPSGIQFGTGDLTVEAHVRIPNVSGGNGGFCHVDFRDYGGGGGPVIFTEGTGNIRMYTHSGYRITSSSGLFTNAAWAHWAWCRASGTSRLFVNGVQAGSNYTDSNTYSSAQIRIGTDYGGSGTNPADQCEFRVTKGIARYTGTFTPPAAPFSDY